MGACALLVACGPAAEPPLSAAGVRDAGAALLRELPVLDQLHWRTYAAELDPLRSHQPQEIHCDPPGFRAELERLEVNTGECSYALLEHPAQLDVPQGSAIRVSMWYFDLSAPEPAQAHVALIFGDVLQWETFLEIPQPGNALHAEFRSSSALGVGEPVRLHLHNHGRNDYLLVSVVASLP